MNKSNYQFIGTPCICIQVITSLLGHPVYAQIITSLLGHPVYAQIITSLLGHPVYA